MCHQEPAAVSWLVAFRGHGHSAGAGEARIRKPVVVFLTLLAFGAASSWLPAWAASVGRTVSLRELSGIDLKGQLHRFGETADCRAIAFVFLSVHCPISNGTVPELRKIAAKYSRHSVEFYGVISDPAVTREKAVQHSTEFGIRFPVLFDASLELRRELRPTHTPQAIVLSSLGSLAYSGRVNNRFVDLGQKRTSASRHDLDDALAAMVRSEPVVVPRTNAVGCPLEDAPRRHAGGKVTFGRDIAPLIMAHCADCHRPGQAAPFPLLTYDDVSAHARQIVNVTGTRFMPPWHPDESYGRFRDVRRLSSAEIQLIRRWIGAGCPEGDPVDLPSKPEFVDGWRLGTPDLILEMPEEFELSADGPDVHQHFVLPTGLRRDRLVTAVEFRPGNPRVVHHASFYVDVSGDSRQLDDRDPLVGFGGGPGPGFSNINSLRSWLPGMAPRRLPPGVGQMLNKDSDLVLEIHYQRTGKVETDRSKVGIHFAESSARQVAFELQVMAKNLDIPAGAKRHRHHASYTLPAATTILDAAPHMHLLGKEMKATATLPDGSIEPLIWIRKWDFNWQGQYRYINPIRLPAGTRIDVDAWFDNSESNGLNPHSPPQRVVWGEQTIDEMAICHFLYTCDTKEELFKVNHDHRRFCEEQDRTWLRLQAERESRFR